MITYAGIIVELPLGVGVAAHMYTIHQRGGKGQKSSESVEFNISIVREPGFVSRGAHCCPGGGEEVRMLLPPPTLARERAHTPPPRAAEIAGG